MTWYAVYNESTGVLTSTGSVIAEPGETEAEAIARLDARGLGVLILPGDPRLVSQIWNTTTREFDPFTPPPPTLDKGEFLALFTEAEREEMFDAARNHPSGVVRKRLQAFLDWLKIVDAVDLDDDYVARAVNGMETVGILGASRAAEIMTGGV